LLWYPPAELSDGRFDGQKISSAPRSCAGSFVGFCSPARSASTREDFSLARFLSLVFRAGALPPVRHGRSNCRETLVAANASTARPAPNAYLFVDS
jgi:hypothetical protein